MLFLNKVGFIGFGNMAQAIITGMISSGNFSYNDIGAYDKDTEKLNEGTEKLKIQAFSSNEELVSSCDCVVLAVKPNALQQVLEPLKENLCKANPLVISIAAGQSIEKLQNFMGYEAAVVRVMPNINAIASQAVSGYTFSDKVSKVQIDFAKKVLNSFGTCVEVDEDKFSAYSAIAGCSPAYTYLFIDALARVGVKYGLTKKESLELVTSVAIETIRNNTHTEKTELNSVVFNAIDAAYKKDKGIG